MDLSAILTAIVVAATAGGGWFQGRRTGVTNALTTASDTVGMLAAQCGELRLQVAAKDAEIEHLRARLAALEGHPPADE
jgi:hypothetical protein